MEFYFQYSWICLRELRRHTWIIDQQNLHRFEVRAWKYEETTGDNWKKWKVILVQYWHIIEWNKILILSIRTNAQLYKRCFEKDVASNWCPAIENSTCLVKITSLVFECRTSVRIHWMRFQKGRADLFWNSNNFLKMGESRIRGVWQMNFCQEKESRHKTKQKQLSSDPKSPKWGGHRP